MKLEERLEMLRTYISTNVGPILVESITAEVFNDFAIVIPANCDRSILNGHYENTSFVPPKWFEEVSKKENSILVIDNLCQISKDEQMKFYELLKYRKIGVFELPKGCKIIITCTKITEPCINESIYSLLVHI